jgi:hypothetical protein
MDIDTGRKQFVEHWKRVGPLLERFQHEELRALSPEAHSAQLDGLLQFGCEMQNAKDPNTSGFVEQQRLFAKARR